MLLKEHGSGSGTAAVCLTIYLYLVLVLLGMYINTGCFKVMRAFLLGVALFVQYIARIHRNGSIRDVYSRLTSTEVCNCHIILFSHSVQHREICVFWMIVKSPGANWKR